MRLNITESELRDRLVKWSEVTALSLQLIEASIRKDYPDLSDEDLNLKLIERLETFRRARFGLQ